MLKTKEEIEKEFDKKFIGYNIFDDSLTRIIMDYVNEIKLYIHQIRQDDLEAVKEMITKNIKIYSLLQKHLADEKAEALQDLLNQLNNLNK